jgi:ABC-2 type transport system permease protein
VPKRTILYQNLFFDTLVEQLAIFAELSEKIVDSVSTCTLEIKTNFQQMEKLWLIIQREYLTRIKKRSFLIGTLLAPLGFLLYMLVIALLAKYEGGDEINVAVLDKSGAVTRLADDRIVRFSFQRDQSLEQLKAKVTDGTYNGVVLIPELTNLTDTKLTVFYYADDKLTPDHEQKITRKLEKAIRDYKVQTLAINPEMLKGRETDIKIDPESINGKDDGGTTKYSTGVAIGIGFVMAFLMFFMVLMYGQMVMRSVSEEKTTRIVEVMISSVKPFQLMLGKILGTGGVGLTQMLIWAILNTGITFLLPMFISMDATQMQGNMPEGAGGMDPEEMQNTITMLYTEIKNQNWWTFLGAFIIYFLGGYLIYASFFAAIGASVGDDAADSQALTLPITLPIVLAFYIIAFAGVRDPNSSLMVFASIFPLFSPIVMPFRLAFDPPVWQILLSIAVLIASTYFCIMAAARIYRTGILLYGKKVGFKEIMKWMFHKG